MAEEKPIDPEAASEAFIKSLEEAGFFRQIHDLESKLTAIAKNMKNIGEAASERLEETESLATHVLAMESVLKVLLKACPVEPGAVEAEIDARAKTLSAGTGELPAVRKVAAELIGESNE